MAASTALSQMSLVFWEVLLNSTIRIDHVWKLRAINEIIIAANAVRSVHTIAYFGKSTDVEPYMLAASGTPKVVITDSFRRIRFHKDFNHSIFFVAVGTLEQQEVWHRLNRAFADNQGSARGVCVLRNYAFTVHFLPKLRGHFAWCWRRGFANVLAVVESGDQARAFDIYRYSRFPDLNIVLLQLQPEMVYFPDKFANLLGYGVRTPMQFDPPRVFATQQCPSNRTEIKGYAAEMFQAFLRKHNGALQVVQFQNSSSYNIPGIIHQLKLGSVDLSMNPYIPHKGARISYPIKMMQWCVLVPFSGEIEAFEYFLRPFQPQMWQACLAGLLFLGVLRGLSDYLLQRKKCKVDFGKATLEMLRLLLFLPIPTVKLGNRFRWNTALYYLQVSTLGFILSNLYLAMLTSFLTKLIFNRQLETLSEMVQQNLSINTVDYEIPAILISRDLPQGFADLLIPRNAAAMTQEMISLKTGQAYAVREDLINFVLLQQNHLLRPLYHVASECITTVPVGFMMPSHSQYEAVLNHFVLRVASSGLTDKWMQATASDGFRAGILRIRKDNAVPTRRLSVNHFQFAWFVLASGSALALICFLVENARRITRRLKLFVIYF